MPPAPPFVLLDDARPGGRRLLYRDPSAILVARAPEEVRPALDRARAALAAGHHVAGFVAYEAGHALAPRLAPLARDGDPLAWLGIFGPPEPVADVAFGLDPAGAYALPPEPVIDADAHAGAVATIQALIAAGDIYQANLTFPARLSVGGHPLALHARLRAASAAGWGAVVATGGQWLLSHSPELFFRLEGGRLSARPMKGTAAPGSDPAALAADPKQRAENLMIVDLMRNDLARVAVAGSVTVPELFAVEAYPTVLQMVSQVEADLAPGLGPADVLEALFPCGSVTGAPKLRAMEAIAMVEGTRGAYTGAIGAMAPDGDAAFNVAIRTIVWEEGADAAFMGLGSGIVADSVAAAEWAECRQKGAFVSEAAPAFDLVETMAFDPDEGTLELERHLARLKASAGTLGFVVDRHALRNELHAATFRATEPRRVRLRLSRNGAVALEVSPIPATPAAPVPVAIVPLPVDPADIRLRHKTSDRRFNDEARAAGGTFEVLFRHPSGVLTEGSFTSLFVERDGILVTPPLALGLMPGVLRQRLLDEGRAVEGDVTEADLAQGFYVGNALRGLIPAILA